MYEVPAADLEHPSPFHRGEQDVQRRVGVRNRIEQVGRRIVRDYMPDEHRQLFEQLPFLPVGSLDEHGRPWASILAGRPGFIHTTDARSLTVRACPPAGDPLAQNLLVGVPLGLLGIQPETRRRNRVNGRVTSVVPGGFALRVEQSFGNCPKYIQARYPLEMLPRLADVPSRREAALLSPEAIALIEHADTFYLATASADAARGGPGEGVDVSHRGGPPGFVRAETLGDRTRLIIPDFLGNHLFNSLGNIVANGRAGLLFVDFATGDALSLSGRAEIVWDEMRSASTPVPSVCWGWTWRKARG